MSERLFVATRKGLFTFERGSSGWQLSSEDFIGDNLPIVGFDSRTGHRYAVLEHGHFGTKLHRSADAGKTWDEIGVPTYPEKPADALDVDPTQKNPIEWKLQKLWALQAGHVDRPGQLWAGTLPGGLFRSDDGGDSWDLVRSLWDHPGRKMWFGGGADLPGIHSIVIHPQKPDQITVGVSCGGVWRSVDGGETWNCKAEGMRAAYMPPDQANVQEVQDPHCVVACGSTPEVFWSQHHNGIFRSVDDCETWTEITEAGPSTFGFPVAVHPEDPDTAWFVPAVKDEKRYPRDGKVVVTRTRDGGASFDVLTEGLPQAHAYDLVFRHSLDIDSSGSRLAFGSTTGNLWITEDQGDTWQTLSHHLPPVYCVRFERSP